MSFFSLKPSSIPFPVSKYFNSVFIENFFSLIVTNLCSIYMLSTTEQRATAVITDLG